MADEVNHISEMDTRERNFSSHIYEEVDFYAEPCDSLVSQSNKQEKNVTREEQTRDEVENYSEMTMPVTADDGEETGEGDNNHCPHNQTSEIASYRNQNYGDNFSGDLTEMAEQNAELQAELEELREDFEAGREKRTALASQNESLKAELKQTQQSLKQHREALQRLASASETAFREFEELKGSYVQEVVCRDKAEKYAATLFAEREAARRQSSMLLLNVAGDRKLMEAMMEVETLTTRVEQQKADYERQIQELQEEVASLREQQKLSDLEEENRQLGEQLSSLQTQASMQHSQYLALQDQYENLEKKLEEATRPPPPPPPPPLPSTGKLSKIFGGKKAKREVIKQRTETKEDSMTQGYSQALNEMMKRIKTGTPLRATPAARPPRQPVTAEDATDATGMCELKNILGRLKKMSPEIGSTSSQSSVTQENKNSELAKAFKKLQKPSVVDDNVYEDPRPEQTTQADVPEPKTQASLREEMGDREAQTEDPRPEQKKPVPRRRRGHSLGSTRSSAGETTCAEDR